MFTGKTKRDLFILGSYAFCVPQGTVLKLGAVVAWPGAVPTDRFFVIQDGTLKGAIVSRSDLEDLKEVDNVNQ